MYISELTTNIETFLGTAVPTTTSLNEKSQECEYTAVIVKSLVILITINATEMMQK